MTVPKPHIRDRVAELGSWLAYLEAVVAGTEPLHDPVADDLQMRLIAVAEGDVRATVQASERWRNFGGIAHGGWSATVFDTLAGFAALSTIAPDELPPTVHANVEYLRPTPLGVDLAGHAQVVKRGRRLITVDVTLAADETLLSRATFLFTPVSGLPR